MSREKKRKRKSKEDDRIDTSKITKEVPDDLVSLVRQKKICDLHVIDKLHISNCIKLYEEDAYYSAAVQVIITTVLEGGALVKIGKLNYPNFKKVERDTLEIQLSKIIPWFMTLGFCLFSYDNPNYIPRAQRMKMRYLKRSMRLQKKEARLSRMEDDDGDSDTRPTEISYIPYTNGHVSQSLSEMENNPANTFLSRETKDYKEVLLDQIDGTYNKRNGSDNKDNQDKKNEKMDDLEKSEQIRLEDDFMGEKIKDYRKQSSAMKHVELPGISSLEVKTSLDIQGGLNGNDDDNNPLYEKGDESGITNKLYGIFQRSGNAGDDRLPSKSNEENNRRMIPSTTKFPVFDRPENRETDVYHIDKISQFALNNPTSRLDASNGDLDFTVPDMDGCTGTFIRYRDWDNDTVKVFFVQGREDSDDESDEDSTSSESDGDEYSDDGFDYGTEDHEPYYDTPGYSLDKNYVTYPNKRRKRIGNQYDFPNRIDDDTFAHHASGYLDPFTTTQMEPLEKNTAEMKSNHIADTLMKEGVVNGHDIVLKNGQYMPDESVDVFLGVRTNQKPIGSRIKAYPNSEGNMGTSDTKNSRYSKSYSSQDYDDSDHEESEKSLSRLSKSEFERKFKRIRKNDIRRQKRKISKQKRIYMVYTYSPPSVNGKIVSHASKLLGSFTRIHNAQNYDTVYHHRSLWPTAVLQQTQDDGKSSSEQKPKVLEQSEIRKMAHNILQKVKSEDLPTQGLRAQNVVSVDTINRFADTFSQKMKAVPAYKETNSRGQKIPPPAELIENQQIKTEFYMKASQIVEETAMYKEAFDNNALSSISPDLSFRMNAFYVPQGYEFKSFSTPPPPISVSEIEDAHIRKVCTIFGVPKRLLDNVEQTKFKPDTASEIQPMIKRLLPIRKAIKSFFSGFYISKNGVIVSDTYKKLNQFIKEETTIVDKIINKIIELGKGLGFFISKSMDEFVNNQRKELSHKKEMEKRELILSKLESEVKEATLNDQKAELDEKDKERKKPKKPNSGNGPPQKKESQAKPAAPPKSSNSDDKNSEKDNSSSSSSSESQTSKFDLSEVEIKPHEKQRNLLIIQKTIAYGKQILADLSYTINFVDSYQVGAIMLEFPTPMVGDLQTLQQIQEVSPLPGNEIKEYILTSHGVG